MKIIFSIVFILFIANACTDSLDRFLDKKQRNLKTIYINPVLKKRVKAKLYEDKTNVYYNLIISIDSTIIKALKLDKQHVYIKTFIFNEHFRPYNVFHTEQVVIPDNEDKKSILKYFENTNKINFYFVESKLNFSNEKVGKHNFYMETFFFVYDNRMNIKPIKNFKMRYAFTVEIPPIYEHSIYTAGIFLQNDSIFSPVGMDVAFTKLGLPDIYWTLSLKENSKYEQLFRSEEQTYSYNYTLKDTVKFYSFFPEQEIFIGVYDRDDISKDDVIGEWKGNIKQLWSKNYKKLKFQHIDSFLIKAKTICVNQ